MKNQLKVRLLSLKPDPTTKKFKFEDLIISFTKGDEIDKFEEQINEALTQLN